MFEFDTGSVRSDPAGKGRYDLLPPEALRRYAEHLEAGCADYGERNWEKGQPVSRLMSSALRHLFQYLEGDFTQSRDPLAAAFWNIGAIMAFEERCRTDLMDLPWQTQV